MWKKENPPKDGSPIVAIGRIMNGGRNWTSITPFCAIVQYHKHEESEGWRYGNGMSVIDDPNEAVEIDLWTELPNANAPIVQP